MDAITKPKRKTLPALSRPYPDLHDHVRALDKAGSADHGRSSDQQGHRDAPAGALAVPRRHRGEGSQGLPVHQRRRQQGPQIRHSGTGRRACRQQGDLPHRHRLPVRGNRCALGRGGAASDSAAHRRQCAVPRDRHHRRGARQAGQRPRRHPDADLDAGLGHRALRDAVAIHHQGPRHRDPEHGQLPRPGEGAAAARHESVARIAPRHLQPLGKAARTRLQETALRRGARRAALHHLRLGAEAAREPRRVARRRRAGRRADQRREGEDRRSPGPGRSRDRHRGLHRHRISRTRGAIRRIRTATSTCRSSTPIWT